MSLDLRETFTFTALGTHWSVECDGEEIDGTSRARVLNYVADFERRFSRFRLDSEVNAYRERAGMFEISEEFAVMLAMADRLRMLTQGVFDPTIAGLLEQLGYNRDYTLTPNETTEAFVLPQWTLSGRMLSLETPAAFDLGGIGKGYCIDRVAGLLREDGYDHILVEAGGDMFGTKKRDGSPWHVAIQYPGKEDVAAGVLALSDRAVAVSDTFRRRWGKWHHIIDPKNRSAVSDIIGVVAVAPSAWYADCMTSALFFASPENYSEIAREFAAEYLVFMADGSCRVSANWSGELFT